MKVTVKGEKYVQVEVIKAAFVRLGINEEFYEDSVESGGFIKNVAF